jgi:hypothetical protein
MSAAIVGSLWCFGLPLIYYVAFVKKGGLLGLWSCMPVTYAFFNIALVLSYTMADWTQISDEIRQQQADDEKEEKEQEMQGGGKAREHAEQSVGLVPINAFGSDL